MVAGFVMIFFVQVAGNSMQIFASEVFPTNARASGFGWASGVGRLATAFIMPAILLVQASYGLTTVFVCLAILLVIAAAAVTQLGPEAKQKGLDEVAPPTRQYHRGGQCLLAEAWRRRVAAAVDQPGGCTSILAAKEVAYHLAPACSTRTRRCDSAGGSGRRQAGKIALLSVSDLDWDCAYRRRLGHDDDEQARRPSRISETN